VTEKYILHMVTPLKHMSPFDANMAIDAGCDAVLTYTHVTIEEITGLVQDAIFSRPPKTGARTGMFVSGKNAIEALDIMAKAKQALVPPFGLSLFADPAGSFTTAAAMVACVSKALREKKGRDLQDAKIVVFGATGVVGFSSGVIAALEGARVTLAGYDGIRRVSQAAQEIKARFGVDTIPADGSDEKKKTDLVAGAEVVFCAGRAGVRVLTKQQIDNAAGLLIATDVNAVPPSGIEGLEVHANATPISSAGALGIGALTIGALKSKTESGLFRKMIAATKPVHLDFRDAFGLARELHG
jgi:methylene-tetrahydromethanopterin dehydrogenase